MNKGIFTLLRTIILLKKFDAFSHQPISGFKNLIHGSERATNIVLFGGIKFNIDDVLYSTISKKNLLGFKNIQ